MDDLALGQQLELFPEIDELLEDLGLQKWDLIPFDFESLSEAVSFLLRWRTDLQSIRGAGL
jgi:hypothetical protein